MCCLGHQWNFLKLLVVFLILTTIIYSFLNESIWWDPNDGYTVTWVLGLEPQYFVLPTAVTMHSCHHHHAQPSRQPWQHQHCHHAHVTTPHLDMSHHSHLGHHHQLQKHPQSLNDSGQVGSLWNTTTCLQNISRRACDLEVTPDCSIRPPPFDDVLVVWTQKAWSKKRAKNKTITEKDVSLKSGV